MKKSKIINVVIAITLGYILAANAFAGDKAKVYCFDVAFHEKTSRLFVAGSQTGTHVFEVTDGKLRFATTIHDGAYHRNLKISGDRAYVADMFKGLLVFDISEKVPVCTWKQHEQNVGGWGIYIHDDHAYLAAGPRGLYIFDISKPDSPKLVGKCKTYGDAWDVWVSGKYAYIADFQKGVTVIDVSQASHPKKLSWVTWDENKPTPEIIRGEGKLAYVAAAKHGLVVIDVSNPRDPKVVDQYKSDPTAYGEGLCAKNGLVYFANLSNNKDENGFIVIDARDPSSLKVKGKCTFGDGVEGVCVAGNRVFVTNRSSGVRSIDVSDPDNPRLVDSSGPMEGEWLVLSDNFLETEVSRQEQKIIDYLEKTKSQILDDRKFSDLSTATNAFLTLISACYHQDQNTFEQVLPFAMTHQNLSSPEALSRFIVGTVRKTTVRRVMIENESPQENDLCAIFSFKSPEGDIDQVYKFGYIEGAWRCLGADQRIDNWIMSATAAAEITRRILRQEAKKKKK
jgi:hypothetical protein